MPAYVTSTPSSEGGFAELVIKREPVNSLNLEVWAQLLAALDAAEADPRVRGLVISSGLSRGVFTAGNDINELYAPRTSLKRYKEFWEVSNRFLCRLFRSPLVTIAAIRGACPAGGCAVAMCCDYSIMTPSGHMGLNEVALGIPVPFYWMKLMQLRIGAQATDQLTQFAKLVSPQQALKLGLVHELAEQEDLLPRARMHMQKLLELPDGGRQATKAMQRDEFSYAWERFSETEAEGAWQMLDSPETKAALERVMAALRAKSGKAKL